MNILMLVGYRDLIVIYKFVIYLDVDEQKKTRNNKFWTQSQRILATNESTKRVSNVNYSNVYLNKFQFEYYGKIR